uniref:C-type lectin domain-containing protein n=1 Tax=Syphacia muris TaxID=451379 RepID=A0A0N5AB58_9BILA
MVSEKVGKCEKYLIGNYASEPLLISKHSHHYCLFQIQANSALIDYYENPKEVKHISHEITFDEAKTLCQDSFGGELLVAKSKGLLSLYIDIFREYATTPLILFDQINDSGKCIYLEHSAKRTDIKGFCERRLHFSYIREPLLASVNRNDAIYCLHDIYIPDNSIKSFESAQVFCSIVFDGSVLYVIDGGEFNFIQRYLFGQQHSPRLMFDIRPIQFPPERAESRTNHSKFLIDKLRNSKEYYETGSGCYAIVYNYRRNEGEVSPVSCKRVWRRITCKEMIATRFWRRDVGEISQTGITMAEYHKHFMALSKKMEKDEQKPTVWVLHLASTFLIALVLTALCTLIVVKIDDLHQYVEYMETIAKAEIEVHNEY